MATTERATRAPRRRKQGPRTVILTSIALVALVATFLAQRIAAGTDPVLGAVRQVRTPRPVVVHRVVRRVIVETTVSARYHGRARTFSSSPVIASQTSSGPVAAAPVTRSS